MNHQVWIVLAVLILAVVLFITEKLRVDLVALVVMSLLLLSGVISPLQGLSGFSNAATVTVGAMFVLSSALYRTGAVSFLASIVNSVFRRGFWFGLLSVMVIVAVLSAFINNTPVIAIFLPIMLAAARETGFSASKILMPVSFASMFGGVCTLIGTSTNILVSSIAAERGLRPFSMFEFAPLGLLMFAAGTAYLVLFGVRLIPERRGQGDLLEEFDLGEYLTEVVIMPDSKSIGTTIKEAPLVHDLDVSILRIQRGGETLDLPSPDDKLLEGDVLLVRCDIGKIRALQEREGVQFKSQAKWGSDSLVSTDYRLVEAIISPGSDIVGSTLALTRFRQRFGASVLAIRHRGRLLREKLSDITLAPGDVLLLEIKQSRLGNLKRSGEFIVVSEMEVTEFRRRRSAIAVATVVGVVAAAALNIVPIVVAAVAGAVLVVLAGCLTLEETYEAIDWKIIFLLAGVLSLGVALDESGAARLVAANMTYYVGGLGLIALVSAFYILTSLLTEAMSNNATAALLAPIAIATGEALGVSSIPFLMAITFAASASFMTPIGYQTNTMIYGPGQYKFVDFVKVGAPLNLIFWIIATFMIPVLWGF